MPKKVGIILIGYKDYVNRFLDECRDSLRAQNYRKELYQVYIIDNCSINDCEYAKKSYPEARCIARPDGNYAAANNLGIKMAIKDGCEYFVIANMDTKFDSNWLSELVKALESDEKIGIAQSKMLLYPKTEQERQKPKINSLGNIMHYLGFGLVSHYGEIDNNPPNPLPDRGRGQVYQGGNKTSLNSSLLRRGDSKSPQPPLLRGENFNLPNPPLEGGYYPEIKGYASGCSFITKKEVIDKVGGYNEDYWMYHDDIEMSWKVKLAGYKIVLAPKSIMYHKYEFSRSIMMLYYIERNRYIAVFTFYRLPTLILILPALLAMDLGMLFYSIAGGWFFTKIKIYGYFLRPSSWLKIFKARREIKGLRQKKDKEIVKNFTGEILYQEISNPLLKYIVNPMLNLYWLIIKKIIVW